MAAAQRMEGDDERLVEGEQEKRLQLRHCWLTPRAICKTESKLHLHPGSHHLPFARRSQSYIYTSIRSGVDSEMQKDFPEIIMRTGKISRPRVTGLLQK